MGMTTKTVTISYSSTIYLATKKMGTSERSKVHRPYLSCSLLTPGFRNRYLILDVLGQGTFGQVVKCQNLKTQEVVAVKVVKNRTAYFNQSMMEVSVLDLVCLAKLGLIAGQLLNGGVA